ncbi:MAG: hypothetical protein IJI19_11040, partial [Ruminococcus sp.]|nr:hypothetical protein [Ruminococcus sp.]
VSDFQVGDDIYVESGDEEWYFTLSDNKITEFYWQNNTTYDYFYTNEFESTGTLQPVQVDLTTVAEGSQYSFTMPAKNVTVKAEFEEAAPAPAKLILNVGENGKVVMDNGTFGNATDASNFSDVPAPVNVADGSKAFIVDGHSANLVEGGSINIATGGEVSFYPSADNTGKITAIPDEGYALYGWYDGDTLYSEDTVLAYQNIDKTTTLTAVFAPAHTVTWKDAGGTILRTDTIAEGKTPSYGSTPTKANDDYHSYHFSGWTDGTNTYGASDTLPAVTGDVTYTAKYTVFTKQFTVFVKTTTGKTITANGVSGDTTVAELKDMVVEESGIPAAEQRLIYAGKEMENAKTLADYNIQKESTIHVVGKSYTVTWKNDDGSVIDTTSAAYGTVPTHDDGYKADGADTVYTFSGWTPEVVAVTGDAEYTATYTESEKPEVIKECTNKFGDFRLYANVPLVQYSDFNDILDGAVMVLTYGDSNTMIPVQDAKGYSYKFYDQTGTEIPAQITDSSSAPGSNYELSDDVTVYTNVINFTRPAGCTAIYIVATAPAPAELISGHSISLDGNIAINFYLDPAARAYRSSTADSSRSADHCQGSPPRS